MGGGGGGGGGLFMIYEQLFDFRISQRLMMIMMMGIMKRISKSKWKK